jgi:DNA polymerase-3 subunit epsilon
LAQLDKYKDAKLTDKSGTEYSPVVNDLKALHDFTNINRNADLAGRIVFNDKGEEVFNFGKHNGKRVIDVLKAEPSYYSWMQNGDFPLYTKKVLTAIKLREFNNR